MDDNNKQICRLCLEVVAAGDGEVIEEIKREKLKVLLINIDFDLSDSAIACNRCLEKLQECFDFKSPFVNVDVKVDINKVVDKELSRENVKLENVHICRLCMLPIEDGSFNCTIDSKDGIIFKDMFRKCLPEVDLNTDHELLICKQCLSKTEKYYEFMRTCHEVEERIKNYCQVAEGYSITGRVILEDVLEFKNYDTPSKPVVTKMECSDVENVNISGMGCFKSEYSPSIECEEVHIKDEFNIEVEAGESDQSEDCNSSQKNGSSKKKISDTDDTELLKANMTNHSDPTKAFGCSECTYKTNHKHMLIRHFLIHKDQSEVQMRKCPLCPFASKYKLAMELHNDIKHDKNIKMYGCNDCSHSTSCEKCFVRHQLKHKKTKKISMYNCEKCAYQTKRQGDLKRHITTHSRDNLFNCEQCSFCSPSLADLHIHMRDHPTDYKDTRIRCDQCDFQTKHRASLWRHKQRHDPTRPTFKCDKCEYRTKENVLLKRHQLSHMKLGETMVYYCATCKFKTKYKGALTSHMLRAKRCARAWR